MLNPNDQDFDQFCAVMEKLNDLPMHVHCIAAQQGQVRTGFLIMVGAERPPAKSS